MTGNPESTQRARLSPAKQALLAKRLQGRAGSSGPKAAIPRRVSDAPAPLSFAQQRLWFLNQLEPDSSAYSMPLAFRLEGPLDSQALRHSLAELVRRHEILRTTFPAVGGEPRQVLSTAPFQLSVVDLTGRPASEREAEARRLVEAEARQPFDLPTGPLFRARLLCLSGETHLLLLSIHHIVFDEWSYGIFCRELAALYRAFSTGQSPALPALPLQYADFAAWQRDQVQGETLEKQLAYWRETLADAPHALDLPTDHPRPAVQTSRSGARHYFKLAQPLSERLKGLARQEQATLFMTLLAAFKVLLYRLSGQADLVVGTPISNRSRAEIEPLIGMFINTIALRTGLNGDHSFQQVLAQVREVALAAYDHQDVPFEKLVEALPLTRDLSRPPLFQVMFILQTTTIAALELPGLTISQAELGRRTATYDLTLYTVDEPEGISGSFEYNPDLFEPATIERLAGHFERLLSEIGADPTRPIAALPLLTEAERQQLLIDWNRTEAAYDFEYGLVPRFEAQVERSPQATAFICDGQTLTYAELNRQANQLAHYLQGLGVEPEVRVGLCLERSFAAVIGLLAIFKAGGVYVPLDPTYPAERLAFIAEDAKVSIVLTQRQFATILPEKRAWAIVLDEENAELARQSEANPVCPVTADNLAYLIYTSGSTGQPKGAAVPHRQIINRLEWMWQAYPFGPTEVSCQKTALNFVDSLWELLGPLLQGSPTVIIPDATLRNPQRLIAALAEQRVSRLWLVPSLLRVLLDATSNLAERLPHLTFWVTSGEALPVDLFERFRAELPQATLYNLYGTSEAWDVTWYAPPPEADFSGLSQVPIGRPLGNVQTYVLNEWLQPVPVGVVGELHVGGFGLADGYVNRPELTTRIFLANPFSADPEARFYKTGDLARYRPDGSLELVGRSDHQVKIRGYRIELGEIEAVLQRHPAVNQAVVVAREDGPAGERRLVAYVKPASQTAPAVADLRDFLRRKLPDYLVPAAFVLLPEFPLTPSGKINRLALPAPEPSRPAGERPYQAPGDALELQLVKIWEKLLQVQPVGTTDNFFALGGHSLLAIQLLAQIEQVTGQVVPLTALFQAPTVAQLAELIRQEGWATPTDSLVAIQAAGSKPPFFCVPGNLGNVFTDLGDLARHLDPEQPFYALQDGVQNPANIERLAAHYLAEIRTVQPEGPYLLGGICSGGMVAFEMAQQLRRQGQAVELLAVIEPPYVHPPTLKSTYHFTAALLGRFVQRAGHQTRQMTEQASSTEQSAFLRLKAKVVANLWAVFRYAPKPYPGQFDLFLSRGSLQAADARQLHWRELATESVVLHELPGTHNSITGNYNTAIEPEHMRALAEKLTARIEAVLNRPR